MRVDLQASSTLGELGSPGYGMGGDMIWTVLLTVPWSLPEGTVSSSGKGHEPMVGDTHLKCVGFISAAGIPYVCSVYCVAGCLIGVIFGGTSVLERKAFAGTSK